MIVLKHVTSSLEIGLVCCGCKCEVEELVTSARARAIRIERQIIFCFGDDGSPLALVDRAVGRQKVRHLIGGGRPHRARAVQSQVSTTSEPTLGS